MALNVPDDELAEKISACLLELLAQHGPERNICPSQAARVAALRLGCGWRELMRPVRTVAAALADIGAIEAVQHGAVIDLAQARGPVRLRLRSLQNQREAA